MPGLALVAKAPGKCRARVGGESLYGVGLPVMQGGERSRLLHSDYLVEPINYFAQLFWLYIPEFFPNSLHRQCADLADFYP